MNDPQILRDKITREIEPKGKISWLFVLFISIPLTIFSCTILLFVTGMGQQLSLNPLVQLLLPAVACLVLIILVIMGIRGTRKKTEKENARLEKLLSDPDIMEDWKQAECLADPGDIETSTDPFDLWCYRGKTFLFCDSPMFIVPLNDLAKMSVKAERSRSRIHSRTLSLMEVMDLIYPKGWHVNLATKSGEEFDFGVILKKGQGYFSLEDPFIKFLLEIAPLFPEKTVSLKDPVSEAEAKLYVELEKALA